MHLLLPFLAALAFALGSMVFKRAYLEGAGVAHTLVVNSVVLGLAFLPLLALDPEPVPWDLLHLPVSAAALFLVGHLLNVLAIRFGDVSVATPLLGVKVTFVALIAWLAFGTPLSTAQWLAAGLTSVGVLAMGLTDVRQARHAGRTTTLALGCSAAFALTDVLIQAWAARVGVWNFLSLQFAALAVLSLALLPVFGAGALRAPRPAWRWILAAAGLSGLQAALITAAIGFWRDAAGVNVIYATRGLWSIALVWWIGHRLGNTERQTAGGRLMAWRLAGAVLILVAVALAVLGTRS